MDLALWIVTSVLVVAFIGAGTFKLVQPYERVVSHGAWAEDFTPAQLNLIGVAELLGVAGLLLPPLLGIAEWLVPIAAACLALDMAVASSVHVRRRDPAQAIAFSAVLGVLSLVVAVGRTWVAPF